MKTRLFVAMAAMAAALGACQSIPEDMTLVEYCADAKKANRDVCKVNVEIDGQKQALAQTNMSVSEARLLASDALSRANAAQASADAAMTKANEPLNCETRTLNRTNTGTCSPGYKVVSCTQTRYTTRAGGLSFLREINDVECRFNDKVLEVQVRCCAAGDVPLVTPVSQPEPVPATPAPRTPQTTS
jgi:hypothetical protein